MDDEKEETSSGDSDGNEVDVRDVLQDGNVRLGRKNNNLFKIKVDSRRKNRTH
jgi:hypothetical protein